MSRKKHESLQELVDRLVPCSVKYWTKEAERLSDAADAGLCKLEQDGYPWWRFTKKEGDSPERIRKYQNAYQSKRRREKRESLL